MSGSSTTAPSMPTRSGSLPPSESSSGPIEEVLSSLEVTPHTYALIVTRGHGHDQEALSHLAPTPASYVGLIGSRRKIKLIFESLREAGIAEADLARVTAPVGLDIGSQTVPEIAISIVAELIARRNLGSRRRDAANLLTRARHEHASAFRQSSRPRARAGGWASPSCFLPFDGEPLIGRVVRALRGGGADPVDRGQPAGRRRRGPARRRRGTGGRRRGHHAARDVHPR